jgi:hypothetical protein
VDLVIPKLEINLAKILSPIKLIQQIINVKQMIVVLNGYFVQGEIINANFQLVILFIDKQD